MKCNIKKNLLSDEIESYSELYFGIINKEKLDLIKDL